MRSYPYREAYLLDKAKQFRAAVDLPLILLGGITKLRPCSSRWPRASTSSRWHALSSGSRTCCIASKPNPIDCPSARTATNACRSIRELAASSSTGPRESDDRALLRRTNDCCRYGICVGDRRGHIERVASSRSEVVGVDLRDADIIADLSSSEGAQSAVDAVLDRCGGVLDGVVLRAGLGPHVPDPRLIIAVNYHSTVALLDGLFPALQKEVLN